MQIRLLLTTQGKPLDQVDSVLKEGVITVAKPMQIFWVETPEQSKQEMGSLWAARFGTICCSLWQKILQSFQICLGVYTAKALVLIWGQGAPGSDTGQW